MPLTPGTRLGPYQISAPLGAGGMGEVFRAKDTRLGRDVAIKVLPQHLSSNPEVRARFEREAMTISSLGHPNICTLFDVGREGDTDYLVMELVEGETLAERLRKGALPIADVLRLGAQIADALDRAHRAGVVHRDLKPGNVMLTKSGAKLMDFGLARATATAGPVSGSGATMAALTQSPTMASPLTAEGGIVGTFQYMPPEQMEGRETDSRSDLWALGCVLYEMASGKRAFEGASQASLIAAILKEQPRPLAELAPLTPPAFERVVRQCLAKDADERWQTASDLRRELLWLAEPGSGNSAAATPAVRPERAGRSPLAWGIAMVATVTAVALGVLHLTAGRSAIPAFTSLTHRPMAIFRAAFAPDGATIVFSAALDGDVPHLYVLRPENPAPQPFGDPGTHLLSVSSKGELAVLTGANWLGHRLFTGVLARMPLGGGAPREVLGGVRDASWNPDGSALAIIRDVGGKDRLEYPVGTVLWESAGYLSDLRFSPSGDAIAYFEHPTRFDDRGSVNLVDLKGKHKMLSDGYWGEEGIAWTRDGREVLFSSSMDGAEWTIYAVTRGGKRRVALRSAGGQTIHDLNTQGRWLTSRDEQSWGIHAHSDDQPDDRDLTWLGSSLYPKLSADGRLVAFTEQGSIGGNNYLSCFRTTDGGDVVRLGEGLTWDMSADGGKVLALISTPPQIVLYPTGAGETVKLERGTIENYGVNGARWFPGADSILFWANEPGRAPRYFVQRVHGGPPRAVTPEGTSSGALSADGRFVIAKTATDSCFMYPIVGGTPRPVPGVTPADQLFRATADGRGLLVHGPSSVPARLERVDLMTGARKPLREIAPEDRVGLLGIELSSATADERSYAYWTWWLHSTLYTVEWKK